MVVWPGVVPDTAVDFGVGIAGAFGAEFPDGPVGAVFAVEEADEGIGGVAVGALRVGRGGAGGDDHFGERKRGLDGRVVCGGFIGVDGGSLLSRK